ncbi:hypothetical protein IAT38_002604 [Cryptococcus sp. DSM 104549]
MDTNTDTTSEADPTVAPGTSQASTGPTSAVPSNLPFARSPRATAASQGGTTVNDSSATFNFSGRPRGPIFVPAEDFNRPDGASSSGQPTVVRVAVVRMGVLPDEEETGEGLCCCGKVLATICGCDLSVWKTSKKDRTQEGGGNGDSDGAQWEGRGAALAGQRGLR